RRRSRGGAAEWCSRMVQQNGAAEWCSRPAGRRRCGGSADPPSVAGLDDYGDTLTLFGGPGPPSTYKVNPGAADEAIAAFLAAVAEEARVDDALTIETDPGETAAMTLEDGRRNLFWGKDLRLVSE